jgi:hypothetical protein
MVETAKAQCEFITSVAVLPLLLMPMFLDFRMREKIVEPINLGAVLIRQQRFASLSLSLSLSL